MQKNFRRKSEHEFFMLGLVADFFIVKYIGPAAPSRPTVMSVASGIRRFPLPAMRLS